MADTAIRSIGVVGAGAWGTALACAAARTGSSVVLWARRAEQAAALARDRENRVRLPGVAIAAAIRVTDALPEVAGCDVLLLVSPAQELRALATRLAPLLPPDRPLVICAKGIEQSSGALLTEVLDECLPGRPQAVLSGPSFAAEVGRDLPTAVTLACNDAELGEALIRAIGSRCFRPYLSPDPTGAAIGGALKNVIALACGIVAGRRLGDNARAALITRGLAEITRLGVAKGGKFETFMGLSGLGDLSLTCSSRQSRNFSFGLALGEGLEPAAIEASQAGIAEGRYTAAAAATMTAALGVKAPILEAVDAVLNRGAAIDETIAGLLARPFTAEFAAASRE
ncbi:MAG: NAD(P)-dependent glycerol-3-phosphate dehydrogenase [Kiloniellales bacterium]|nr:NAD(P)-dependent glycerol-3-phosphate dehydrogenase [Kiloniellales bacterium]